MAAYVVYGGGQGGMGMLERQFWQLTSVVVHMASFVRLGLDFASPIPNSIMRLSCSLMYVITYAMAWQAS